MSETNKKFNEIPLSVKLQQHIEKNMVCKEFEIIPYKDYDSIHFKIQHHFSSNDLKGMFSYWGLNWRDFVWEWHVKPKSRISVVVDIFFYHLPDKNKCSHEFKKVSGWSYDLICNKCGLFKEVDTKNVKK